MRCIPIALIFVLFSINAIADTRPTAVVVVNILKIRDQPNLDGKVIGKIQKGSIVKFIEKSKDEIRIDGIYNYWCKIQIDNITGWVFGGYLFDRYYKSENSEVVAFIKYGEISNFCIYNIKTKNEISIKVSLVTYAFAISPSMKYVAFDSGEDSIGGIEIWDIQNSKCLYHKAYTRHKLIWNDEKISIEEIIWNDDDCKRRKIKWKETIFDNGKIYEGKKSAEIPYGC